MKYLSIFPGLLHELPQLIFHHLCRLVGVHNNIRCHTWYNGLPQVYKLGMVFFHCKLHLDALQATVAVLANASNRMLMNNSLVMRPHKTAKAHIKYFE